MIEGAEVGGTRRSPFGSDESRGLRTETKKGDGPDERGCGIGVRNLDGEKVQVTVKGSFGTGLRGKSKMLMGAGRQQYKEGLKSKKGRERW